MKLLAPRSAEVPICWGFQLAALSTFLFLSHMHLSSKVPHVPGLLGREKMLRFKTCHKFLDTLLSKNGLYFLPLKVRFL